MNNLSNEYLTECKNALNAEQTHSLSTTENWAHVNRELVHQDWDVLYKKLAQYADETAVDNVNVQTLMKEHFEIACRFYTPSKEAYIGMGVFYKENEDMKNFIIRTILKWLIIWVMQLFITHKAICKIT